MGLSAADIVSIVIASLSGVVASALLLYYISAKSWRKTKYYKTLKSLLSREPDKPMVMDVVGYDTWINMLFEIERDDPHAFQNAQEMYDRYKPHTHRLHHEMTGSLLGYQ